MLCISTAPRRPVVHAPMGNTANSATRRRTACTMYHTARALCPAWNQLYRVGCFVLFSYAFTPLRFCCFLAPFVVHSRGLVVGRCWVNNTALVATPALRWRWWPWNGLLGPRRGRHPVSRFPFPVFFAVPGSAPQSLSNISAWPGAWGLGPEAKPGC
jgi:hypothetical protein